MTVRTPRKKSKNPPYFSHEFVIANHGDIVSIVLMFIAFGLFNQKTYDFASGFVFLHHNATEGESIPVLYSPGIRDACMAFFYTLLCVVMHAVIQEYLLDKYSKKLNLTMTRLTKFNESVHLTLFYILSIGWAVYNIVNEEMIQSVNSLWDGYPHRTMTLWTKLFWIFQICYWLHEFPELYFQKVKQELIFPRALQALLYSLGITFAYIGGLSKLCIILLTVHYTTDIFLHVARALHLFEYSKIASFGFTLWNVLFIPTRMFCTILTFFVLQYGLGKQSIPVIDTEKGNFNTPSLRFAAMIYFFLTQALMIWNFTTFHQGRRRGGGRQSGSGGKGAAGGLRGWLGQSASDGSKRKEKKKATKRDEDDNAPSSDVADSDQSAQREVRRRKPVRS